ncbi:hypothetical protein [Burkholderia multivorans]|uniref:hypothetical protein n=1 Tax=Burkholderia multivorans TaxID=87883 RepID=UPI0012DCC59C|nr:hypothetical protein [Burkholderia multivorans]MBU9338408.1 hypothetical protein [Burkholderia multivorans]MCA8139197.1 hypothetical protein [Burkholderia multivorans]MCO1363371.1 hypothetical protein [Burkholderia multivorans]MCO1379588.1 hypothetical protein [Burkholderia multivorans]QGR63075.1 hypothetical protein FOC27_23095 [Burkholderia multivorans]
MDGIIFDYQHTHQWVILVISSRAPQRASSMRTIARSHTSAHATHERDAWADRRHASASRVAARRPSRSHHVAALRDTRRAADATPPLHARIPARDEASSAANRRAAYSTEIAQRLPRAARVRS